MRVRLLFLLVLLMLLAAGPMRAFAGLTLGYFNDGPLVSGHRQAEQLAAYLGGRLNEEITVKRVSHEVELLKALDSGLADMAVLPDYLLFAARDCEPLATPVTLDNQRNFKLYLLVDQANPAREIAERNILGQDDHSLQYQSPQPKTHRHRARMPL